MPGFDGTGPLGLSPRTGWGFGRCGLGLGWRRGWGRRFGRFGGGPWWFLEKISKKEEIEILREKAEILKEELRKIEKRINELKGSK